MRSWQFPRAIGGDGSPVGYFGEPTHTPPQPSEPDSPHRLSVEISKLYRGGGTVLTAKECDATAEVASGVLTIQARSSLTPLIRVETTTLASVEKGSDGTSLEIRTSYDIVIVLTCAVPTRLVGLMDSMLHPPILTPVTSANPSPSQRPSPGVVAPMAMHSARRRLLVPTEGSMVTHPSCQGPGLVVSVALNTETVSVKWEDGVTTHRAKELTVLEGASVYASKHASQMEQQSPPPTAHYVKSPVLPNYPVVASPPRLVQDPPGPALTPKPPSPHLAKVASPLQTYVKTAAPPVPAPVSRSAMSSPSGGDASGIGESRESPQSRTSDCTQTARSPERTFEVTLPVDHDGAANLPFVIGESSASLGYPESADAHALSPSVSFEGDSPHERQRVTGPVLSAQKKLGTAKRPPPLDASDLTSNKAPSTPSQRGTPPTGTPVVFGSNQSAHKTRCRWCGMVAHPSHEKRCTFRQVGCPNCKAVVVAKDYEAHSTLCRTRGGRSHSTSTPRSPELQDS